MSATANRIEEPDDDIGAMLRKSVQDFCARHSGVARTRRLRGTEPGYDRAIWRDMADAGWARIALPEAHGGLGLGLAELCVVAEELGADLAPEPFAAATLAALIVAGGDNVALQARLLPTIASGDLLPAFAWQEAPNLIDPLSISTTLTADGSGFLLAGTKRFVPAAGGADGFAVTATGPDGPVAVWVPADACGLTITPDLAFDGSMVSSVAFDGVRISSTDIVASAKVAPALLGRVLDEALVLASAELLGILSAAFRRTRDYACQRVQFGKAIGSFQALQHRMVDLFIQQELTRACVEDAIAACAAGDAERRSLCASAAKSRASAAAVLIGRQSIQIHGAIGYADEHDIGLFLKRAVVRSAWLGTATAHRQRFSTLYDASATHNETSGK